jgi:NAD-dependent histone deacetylase SIR2
VHEDIYAVGRILTLPRQRCIDCKKPYPEERMHDIIRNKQVPHCLDDTCDGLVKPDIVFFGEQLPEAFFANRDLPSEADLCIVMGTSLSVHPFASLPTVCADGCPRLLINSEQVGDMGRWPDDVLLLEDCDNGVRKLAEACGWLEELEALWATTARDDEHPPTKEETEKKSRDELLEDEVNKLTKEVEESLRLGEAQHQWLENHVDNKLARRQEDETSKESTASGPQPAVHSESRIMAPVSGTGAPKTDPGGGLGHVFPHLKKLSS